MSSNLLELKSRILKDSMLSTLLLLLMTSNGRKSMKKKDLIMDFSDVSLKKEPSSVARNHKLSSNILQISLELMKATGSLKFLVKR